MIEADLYGWIALILTAALYIASGYLAAWLGEAIGRLA